MALLKILVFGSLRLVTNCDYNRLQEQASEHSTLRKMLGHEPYCTHAYHIQTLQDNISLFTPEILDQINQIVVEAGHPLVMQKQTDDQVTVAIAEGAKQRFPMLSQVSYDKGFWSPDNLAKLELFLDKPTLSKKGKLSADDKKHESHPEFEKVRRKHSAVESVINASVINALESTGLNKCPDKGIESFKQYVSLAVLATNLKRLGKILLD